MAESNEAKLAELKAKAKAAMKCRDWPLARALMADVTALIVTRPPETIAAVEAARGLRKMKP